MVKQLKVAEEDMLLNDNGMLNSIHCDGIEFSLGPVELKASQGRLWWNCPYTSHLAFILCFLCVCFYLHWIT